MRIGPQFLEQPEAIELWHFDIEQHQVVALVTKPLPGFNPVRRRVHGSYRS